MRINNILVFVLAVILLSGVVNAQSNQILGTFKQSSSVNLIQLCSNCTYNNITTIIYPNSSQLVLNIEMQKRGTYYNYTLSSIYTKESGDYIVNGFGDLNGQVTVWNYYFTITPSGTKESLTQVIAIPFILIIIAVLFLYASMMFDNKRWLIKSALMITALLIIVLIVNLLLDYSISTKQGTTTFYVFAIVLSATGFMIIWLFVYYLSSIVKAVRDARSNKDSELL